MLSSRTMIIFLAVAALIVAAVFATTSMINLPGLAAEQPMTASNAQGLAQYHQSERAGQTKAMGLAQYYRSERGLNENVLDTSQDAGLAIYFNSERNIPIGSADPFDKLRHDGPGR